MSETVAFLPNLQESVMEELRTTEGMIFRDEGVKKLFLDLKSFILDSMTASWNLGPENYKFTLEKYLMWTEETEAEEMKKMSINFQDAIERLTNVSVLYAKHIYARSNQENSVSMKKPRMEKMLRGMYTRLARMTAIINASFFTLDPIRQDFVFRDVFRLALGNDCVILVKTEAPEVVIQEEAFDKEIEEVGPDDSISRVMHRLEESAAEVEPKAKASVAESAVTNATKKSEYRQPKNMIKRIIIDEAEE
jgi:hypothetical protein